MGFEPMNNGFADRPLRPLGYVTRRMKTISLEDKKGQGWLKLSPAAKIPRPWSIPDPGMPAAVRVSGKRGHRRRGRSSAGVSKRAARGTTMVFRVLSRE